MTGDRAYREFRDLHRPGTPMILANAWDVASAAALLDAGFAAIGTTSLGVAAAHGLPDGYGRAGAETLALARRLSQLPCLLSVDIEAGFSEDPAEVVELAVQLAETGVVGINLEDGRADGSLAPIDRQLDLITAIKSRVPRLFVNARTDTHWLAKDPPLAHTVERVEAYCAAGADGVFVPGLAGDDSIRTVAATTDAPLNVLFLPGRHTVGALAELGVARISYGSLLFRTAVHAAVTAAQTIRDGLPFGPGSIPSYAEINRLSGVVSE